MDNRSVDRIVQTYTRAEYAESIGMEYFKYLINDFNNTELSVVILLYLFLSPRICVFLENLNESCVM